MTRNEMIGLGALAAAAVAVMYWAGGAGEGIANVQGAVEGVTWKAGYPSGHEHLAKPWEIGTVLWGPHPLYCDQYGPGKYRDPLIEQGWAWISDPPSEATI
jgi:hypothetical protein